MKAPLEDLDELDDDLPPILSARIEQLSRKWAGEAQSPRQRQPHRANSRRRIEDWHDEYRLTRELDDLTHR